MANCPLCNDTGKRMQANGQPGAYLGCSCTASLERADMHFDASKFVIEYPLGGDNLDDDLAWFIHQRAKALGRAEALAELHPQWLAEKERADRAEVRIAELEAQIAAIADTDKLRELRARIYEMKEAAYTYGDNSKEAVCAALDGVLDEIDEAASTALQAPVREGWIACSDRLPELYQSVVLLNENLWMNTGNDEFDTNWHGAGWLIDIGYTKSWAAIGETRGLTLDAVTHWMPLPAAPVQQEGE